VISHEILVVDIANKVSTVNIIPTVNLQATNEFKNSNTFLEEVSQSENDILELCLEEFSNKQIIQLQTTTIPLPCHDHRVLLPATMLLHLKRN